MTGATMAHYNTMKRVMKNWVATPKSKLSLEPNASRNGQADFKFTVEVYADSEYAKEQSTRRSVNGWCVFLNDVPAVMRGKGMPVVALFSYRGRIIRCHTMRTRHVICDEAIGKHWFESEEADDCMSG